MSKEERKPMEIAKPSYGTLTKIWRHPKYPNHYTVTVDRMDGLESFLSEDGWGLKPFEVVATIPGVEMIKTGGFRQDYQTNKEGVIKLLSQKQEELEKIKSKLKSL
jgi:hypothetical protein